MKYILVLLCFISSVASAQLLDTQKQDVPFTNILSNPGFENGRAKWTASGGATAITTSGANLLDGKATYSWTPSGAQTLTQTVSLPKGLYGRNCTARIMYQGGDSTNYTFYVTDGSNTLSNTVTLTASTYKSQEFVTFICPTSGSVVFTLAAGAAATQIHLDSMFLGENYLLSQITQATQYGFITSTGIASCQWSTSSATYANFSADTDCNAGTASGNASAPSTKIPGITFASLPPGRYKVYAQGLFYSNFSTTTNGCYYTLSDGTNRSGFLYLNRHATTPGTNFSGNTLFGEFTYTTGQSNITFQVQGTRSTGDGTCDIQNTVSAANANTFFEISVERYPLASETAYTPDVLSWKIDANLVFTSSIDLGTSDQAAYITPNGTDGTLTQNTGSAPVGISCSSTNDNSVGSTTCSAGSEEPGIVANFPRSGQVEVCYAFSHAWITGASGAVRTTFQPVLTANGSQTISEEGKDRINSGSATASISGRMPIRVCGTFNLSSAGKKTIRLMYEQDVNATVTANIITADASALEGQRDIHITARYIDQQIPAPNIVNSLITQYTGQTRVEVADLNCDSASAITKQHGTWVSSIGNISAGQCTITLTSGMFSSTPYCTVSNENYGANNRIVAAYATSTTNVFLTSISDAGAASTLVDVSMICVGPK